MKQQEEKKRDHAIYVIGNSNGYARWIEGHLVYKIEDADVVVLTGGEDISPELYGEKTGRNTYFSPERDAHELREYHRAIALGKPIWGTCRGAQFLCAMAGGKLIQDMDHGGSHPLFFYDDKYTCISNTLHHQMQYPYTMVNKEDYYILAHTYGLSRYYRDGNEEEMTMPEKTEEGIIKEPEFVYYPKIRGLGIQGHPEMMPLNSDMVEVCRAFLNLEVDEVLEDVLQLQLPVSEIIERSYDFKFSNKEKEMLAKIKARPQKAIGV